METATLLINRVGQPVSIKDDNRAWELLDPKGYEKEIARRAAERGRPSNWLSNAEPGQFTLANDEQVARYIKDHGWSRKDRKDRLEEMFAAGRYPQGPRARAERVTVTK